MRRIVSAALLAASLCLALPVALSAVTEEDLKPRFIARDGDIAKLKADHVIGENVNGTLEVIDPDTASATTKKLVADEDADRQQLFQLMAARLSAENPDKPAVTVEAVARENAMRLFKAAKAGEMWKTKNGEWKAKQ
jgi:uncharacterized protein YdbL (DUF1318 family)